MSVVLCRVGGGVRFAMSVLLWNASVVVALCALPVVVVQDSLREKKYFRFVYFFLVFGAPKGLGALRYTLQLLGFAA
jgi:hypothetical protein